jgi:hypothetical protein
MRVGKKQLSANKSMPAESGIHAETPPVVVRGAVALVE